MKAKIITIVDLSNYGNRLQNYAVQTVLEKLGFKTETIYAEDVFYYAFSEPFIYSPESKKQKIKLLFQKMTGYKRFGNREYWVVVSGFSAFNKFNKKYIPCRSVKSLDEIGDADFYVAGSDQIWNPTWYVKGDLRNDVYTLSFAPPEKRVCFSPSFGINELPEEWKDYFRNELSKFPMLSSREAAGADIIKNLTGKDAQVTIDPTLMLERSEWDKIAAKTKRADCNRDYILTYFLGGRNERVNADLEKYSAQTGAVVYNMQDVTNHKLYAADPGEFIYLIAHAKLIVTDSFHACVFSFLYDKPFVLYGRQDNDTMMSRMDTLFNTLDLKRKYVDSGLPNELLECDYSVGHRRIEAEKRKSMDFLKKSLRLE